ncbi:uncharacterized protein LOC133173413 [Saccostrea echinata]|uniref:uncharacterized protein LOC133173413 n=1 Tax=Saccostrea echinata TaxID=191078 RepID=UPI002A80710E|nr:uncharacterized protein LOC133173413 [Saccostrea echinata]
MKTTWKTKKSRLVSSKAKHQASVVKKKQQKPDLKNIPGTEYLSNKQKKHVKVHTKSARIKVSGKRKRKVLKRLKHGKKRETEEREDVDMGDESGKKQRRKSKTKSEGMDVDED